MSLSRGICDLSYPLGKASAFVKFWKCLGLRPCHFLGFTKALAFPKGYDRFYISLLAGIYPIHGILIQQGHPYKQSRHQLGVAGLPSLFGRFQLGDAGCMVGAI